MAADMKFAGTVLLVLGLASSTYAATMSDAQVRQAIIRESLTSYPGTCPWPYNTDRAGRSCGRRSAYSRPGGYSPICYETDVTPQMVSRFRAEHL